MNFTPWSRALRIRCELACTEALLAKRTRERDEALHKLSAGGRACADRQRAKIWAKAAELAEGA